MESKQKPMLFYEIKKAVSKHQSREKNCVRHGYFDEIAITVTLYQSNVHEIPQIIDFAESLGGTRST